MRDASLLAIRSLLANTNLGRTCELGVGRSVFIDIAELQNPRNELYLLDESPEMLAHSANLNGIQSYSSVETAALPARSFDTIIASLGDAYNTEEAWRNVISSLARRGRVLYTGPALAWAKRFRSTQQIGHPDEALFETKAGRIFVPSHVLSEDAQFKLWQKLGLEPLQWMNIYPGALSTPLSPKILNGEEPFCVAALAQLP
jgi:hypothetical protein